MRRAFAVLVLGVAAYTFACSAAALAEQTRHDPAVRPRRALAQASD
jgi:hypothetical protein